MTRRCYRGPETYKYFINTSRLSIPPSDLYIRPSIGDISDCLIDCSISTTVAKCTSYVNGRQPHCILLPLQPFPQPGARICTQQHSPSPVVESRAPTFVLSSPPYGAFSKAPLNAPSASPPLSNCRICPARLCTSAAETGATGGARVDMSKFADDSGSRRSMFMVRQFISGAIVLGE